MSSSSTDIFKIELLGTFWFQRRDCITRFKFETHLSGNNLIMQIKNCALKLDPKEMINFKI